MPAASAIVYADEDVVSAELVKFRAKHANLFEVNHNYVKIEFVNEPGNLVVTASNELILRLLVQDLQEQGLRHRTFALTPATAPSSAWLTRSLFLTAFLGSFYVIMSSDLLESNASLREQLENLAFRVPYGLWLIWLAAVVVGFVKLLFYQAKLPSAPPRQAAKIE